MMGEKGSQKRTRIHTYCDPISSLFLSLFEVNVIFVLISDAIFLEKRNRMQPSVQSRGQSRVQVSRSKRDRRESQVRSFPLVTRS
jgi:hypothetical protein